MTMTGSELRVLETPYHTGFRHGLKNARREDTLAFLVGVVIGGVIVGIVAGVIFLAT